MAKAPVKTRQTAPPVTPKDTETSQAGDSGGNSARAMPAGTKNKQAAAIREIEVLQSVEGLNLDTVSGSVATTQVEVQKSLAALSAKLVEQLQVLRNVEEAIRVKREDLKQLYDIEAAAVELDELHAKIEAQRESWEDEQARRQRDWSEMESERNKQWARRESEYQYEKVQEHKRAEDTFKNKMEELEKANRNRQEILEKGWTERETELKKREQELQDLRAKVEAIPELIKKESNGAVAVATNSVKKEYETKAALSQKDAETAQKLAAQEVGSMKQVLAAANAQLAELKAQVEQAHRDVKEISQKALESSSDRSAMQALQRALEQQQSSKQGK